MCMHRRTYIGRSSQIDERSFMGCSTCGAQTPLPKTWRATWRFMNFNGEDIMTQAIAYRTPPGH